MDQTRGVAAAVMTEEERLLGLRLEADVLARHWLLGFDIYSFVSAIVFVGVFVRSMIRFVHGLQASSFVIEAEVARRKECGCGSRPRLPNRTPTVHISHRLPSTGELPSPAFL